MAKKNMKPPAKIDAGTVGLSSPGAESTAPDPPNSSCSEGWYITGYYTAVEDEFNGPPTQITVQGAGPNSFPADFLHHVTIEGWGKTRFGWYLGRDGGWIKGDAPLGAVGQPLEVGVVAVDRSMVPLGTKIHIPNMKVPWNSRTFVAGDTGGAIQRMHIDVYCGEGPQAHQETLRITEDNRRVCLG